MLPQPDLVVLQNEAKSKRRRSRDKRAAKDDSGMAIERDNTFHLLLSDDELKLLKLLA